MRADLASEKCRASQASKVPQGPEAKHAVTKQRKQLSTGYIICIHTRHNNLPMLIIDIAHSLVGSTAAKMAGLQEGVEHLLAIISSFSKTHIPSLCSAIIKG